MAVSSFKDETVGIYTGLGGSGRGHGYCAGRAPAGKWTLINFWGIQPNYTKRFAIGLGNWNGWKPCSGMRPTTFTGGLGLTAFPASTEAELVDKGKELCPVQGKINIILPAGGFRGGNCRIRGRLDQYNEPKGIFATPEELHRLSTKIKNLQEQIWWLQTLEQHTQLGKLVQYGRR